jgi:hypothetical protein
MSEDKGCGASDVGKVKNFSTVSVKLGLSAKFA